jgi:hypothetical protein
MASKTATKKASAARKPLAAKDEKTLASVVETYPDKPWAERYARKVLKVQAGLRTTPAPVPPQLGKEKASAIDVLLGYERPKRETKPKKAAAKKTPTRLRRKPS